MKNLGGIYPAVLTPFADDGEVFEDGTKAYVDYLIQRGVDGLFICGSLGSGPIMSTEERRKVTELIISHVAGRVPVIVHVGTIDVRVAERLAKHAESVGAAAISAVPSYYYQISFDQVKDVYKRLVDAVNIPVWVYNNPPTTRVTMTVDLIVQLAELGTKGFKDSSASLKLFQDVLLAVGRDDFTIMQGTPFLAFPSFIAGADGYIGGLATVYPQFLKAMFVAVKEGDAKRAVELERATPELFAL
ncbi:MAG: dihydrodipicolinate synthase family protein, partial [Chloroflexota bacterium]